MRKKIVILGLALLVLTFLIQTSALAISNFTTDYKASYTILPNAKVKSEIEIVLTNKSSKYHASSYNIQLGLQNIENLKINDPHGPIQPTVTQNNNGKSIAFIFSKPVAGINKRLKFNISFDTNYISRKSGKIWQIYIPGLARQNEFQSYNVSVYVPDFLSAPAYIKPKTKLVADKNQKIISFSKDQLGKSGISIAFGTEQKYKFKLSYHLNNPNLFPIKREIALPPSTNYQEVQIDKITPLPLDVKEDSDGNRLARYALKPFQKMDITVYGRAKISLVPKKEPVSYDKLKEYLKERQYWPISNNTIKRIASKLKTPEGIYKYVVKNLTYDFSRVIDNKPRLGGASALSNKNSAVCLEFTDLFITLARASGIPAREINGFAYTTNTKERPLSLVKDILHAWPEYYDFKRQTWVMVDPTWENTTGGTDYFHTLDFDHFAFVIKGKSSTYPIAPGGYKYSYNQSAKDVYVDFDK